MPADASDERLARYRTARRQIDGLLQGPSDPIAAMASVSAVLHENLPWVSWVGFYRVVASRLLRVGPYQGPVGCLEISFDQGVCGAAAREGRTQIVADVHSFPGHIACDPRSSSEIVVPVLDRAGRLAAVLDLDSHEPGAFDELDRRELEAITALLTPCFGGPSAD